MSNRKEAPLSCCGFKNSGLEVSLTSSKLSGELCRKPARRVLVKIGGLEIAVPICLECEKLIKGETDEKQKT
jgi:hypothetical protein